MLQSISKDIHDFKTKGRLVIGGDFNARCGVNGDPVTRTAGRRLLEFCAAQKLCMLNKNGMTIGGVLAGMSDHRPLVYTGWWAPKGAPKPTALPTRVVWNVNAMSTRDWNLYERYCDASMVRWTSFSFSS